MVHARTLEFYRQMGLSEPLLREVLRFDAMNLWVRRRRVARAEFHEMGKGMSFLSQTAISYRGSAPGGSKLGSIHEGDRLPWVGLDGSGDNHLVRPDGHVGLVDAAAS